MKQVLLKLIFSNKIETSNNEFQEVNRKSKPTFYSQNQLQKDRENEYFENESNSSFNESSKTYFTPTSKAQKERQTNNRRFVKFKSQQRYNRSSSRNWRSDYQETNS